MGRLQCFETDRSDEVARRRSAKSRPSGSPRPRSPPQHPGLDYASVERRFVPVKAPSRRAEHEPAASPRSRAPLTATHRYRTRQKGAARHRRARRRKTHRTLLQASLEPGRPAIFKRPNCCRSIACLSKPCIGCATISIGFVSVMTGFCAPALSATRTATETDSAKASTPSPTRRNRDARRNFLSYPVESINAELSAAWETCALARLGPSPRTARPTCPSWRRPAPMDR